jgi:hypothetical protein
MAENKVRDLSKLECEALVKDDDNLMPGFYDRNEILCENGEVDFRKATHRIIKHKSAIGDMYVNEVRDLSEWGASWITLPGIFPDSIQAAEAYEKFIEKFQSDE